MVKAVIFDCFGVLVSSASISLINRYPDLKTDIEDAVHQADYGLLDRDQLSHLLAEIINVPYEQIDDIFWNYSRLDQNATSWVADLKSAGKYKIGMLSNVGSGIFESFFDKKHQSELFDDVVLSFEVGLAKPEVAIFELAAQRLGVITNECVMIDDRMQNIEAASNAGMYGIVYSSRDQAQADLEKLLETQNA